MRNTHVNIDLTALSHNLQRVKQYAPHSQVVAMVKANAYGHGVLSCLPALQAADALGVACLDEALPLQQAGWDKKVVIIEGAFSEQEWQTCIAQNIDCVIHCQDQLDWALAHLPKADNATKTTVWLKFNTGMNRLGFSEHEILPIAKQLYDAGYHIILTTHFANADIKDHPNNQQQIDKFNRVLAELKAYISQSIQGSLCNSAGIVNFVEHHHDWVRPGIILYGATPVADQTAAELNLRPVMQFDAAIMAVHDLQAGDSVGYGSRWTATGPSRIGIVSVGYADGYPRVISDAAYLTAKGEKLPIIGRVAMDMLMVDLGNSPMVDIGTPVQLWGNSPTIDEVASWNDTISYELLCLVTSRPHWHYQNADSN